MGTKTDKIIQNEDILKYLSHSSDFVFELSVVNMLSNLQYECEHAGTYYDPITRESKQFDIRASFSAPEVHLKLVIECLNIDSKTPILAHSVRRKNHEAYHSEVTALFENSKRVEERAKLVKKLYPDSIYGSAPENLVVKSLSKIWEEKNSENFVTGSDHEIQKKATLAISSLYDVVRKQIKFHSEDPNTTPTERSVIIPILIVPSGVLWNATFDETGKWNGKAENVEHVSLYIDRELNGLDPVGNQTYGVSHLEILTTDGINKFHNNLIAALIRGKKL